MRKNLLLIMFVFTAFTHGMEPENRLNFWTVTFGGTKINLNQGFIGDVDNKTDVIVVGANQQRDSDYQYLGEWFFTQQLKTVRGNNKWVRVQYDIFLITEPCIRYVGQSVQYHVVREMENSWAYYFFVDNNAIEEASKDLAFCYKKSFNEILKHLANKIEKRIAFSTLSVDVGFPREKAAPIAVKTILECINKQNNSGAYDCIEFFVEQQSEFDLYKLLLMQGCGLTAKICLLYCAYNDSEHFLSSLFPREIIHCIAKFM